MQTSKGSSKTELNKENLITAINTYVFPALTYNFQVLKWTNTERITTNHPHNDNQAQGAPPKSLNSNYFIKKGRWAIPDRHSQFALAATDEIERVSQQKSTNIEPLSDHYL